jgi:hypothetical protein
LFVARELVADPEAVASSLEGSLSLVESLSRVESLELLSSELAISERPSPSEPSLGVGLLFGVPVSCFRAGGGAPER